jgi:primosomal protein N' (replication factor Y)
MYKNFVQVILNNNSKSTDRLFTYGVPKEFEDIVQIGERVSVSFGSSKHMIEALIVSIDSRCSFPLEKIKPITAILDDSPVVSRDMIKLIFWMRERYICKYSDVLRLVTPHNLNVKSAYEKYVSLCEDKPLDEFGIKKTENQLKVINYLKKNKKERIKKLPGELNVSYATINNLIKKNILKEEYILCKSKKQVPTEKGMELSEEQQKAYDEIISSENKVFLLHGVTGSGKTEVYMDVIEYYIKQNKQSIMLVPEISLTTQTIDRFRKRFGKKIAVFHSRLSRKEKSIEWSRVINRDADVVIGARSAIFAPIKDLGVIVIDEEHEDSYISSSSPKYDTTEVAIKMAYICGCKVILGSATPSINTYYMAMNGQIEKVELKRRINNQMPDIKIIDMGHELDKGNNTIISEELYDSIRTSLSKKEQVILFLNKRGYAGFVSCKKCGYVARCDRCDVSMTYHIRGNMLKCHYCGRTKKMMFKCPKCGSEKIEQFSAGTQHVEKLANKLFPEAVIERMDFDSMTDKGAYENIYIKFKERKIDILIGTQMLAKGFDFPEVTTVGILSADAIINLPFYNSGEKTFQLITQVSGRAGRGSKKGMVFVQTYEPENFIVNAAKNNNYEVFIKEELKLRKEFAFPPFINIINVCLISKNEKLVNKTANEKYQEIKTLVKDMVEERRLLLYRPVPHSIYKVNDEYRINLFMKSSNHGLRRLRKIIRSVYMEKDIENIKVSININTNTI